MRLRLVWCLHSERVEECRGEGRKGADMGMWCCGRQAKASSYEMLPTPAARCNGQGALATPT